MNYFSFSVKKNTLYLSMHTCNAESQKRSAKGYNFKEDDRIPVGVTVLLYALLCIGLAAKRGPYSLHPNLYVRLYSNYLGICCTPINPR